MSEACGTKGEGRGVLKGVLDIYLSALEALH